MPVFPVITMQRFDFKNSTIAVVSCYDFKSVLNSGAKVCFCGGRALKLNYYNLNSSDEGYFF